MLQRVGDVNAMRSSLPLVTLPEPTHPIELRWSALISTFCVFAYRLSDAGF